MKEHVVEQKLIRGCRLYGLHCIKSEVLGKGWPDRMILGHRGQIAFVELKRPGVRRAGKRQRLVQALLRALGFRVEQLNTPEAVELFLSTFSARCTPREDTVEGRLDG